MSLLQSNRSRRQASLPGPWRKGNLLKADRFDEVNLMDILMYLHLHTFKGAFLDEDEIMNGNDIDCYRYLVDVSLT